jgi:HsdM N-terminal domain
MIAGELKSKVDKLWTTFWSNGISNPLSVIEQISYLLFIKRLDDLELAREKQVKRLGGKVKDPEGIASNIDTAKTELLFRALFLRLLKKGGRHAPLPEGERILVTGSQKSACYFRLTINSRGDLLPSLSPITGQIPSAPRYCLSEI